MWALDAADNTWISAFAATPLDPRVGHVAFFDANVGQTVVFGGLAYHDQGATVATLGDQWTFNWGTLPLVSPVLRDQGTTCATSSQCGSGFCVDGVCCESACTATCATCNLPGQAGLCRPSTGLPLAGHSTCTGANVCFGCNGTDMTSCHASASGSVCAPAGCSGSVLEPHALCLTSGGSAIPTCIPEGTVQSCAPYKCASEEGSSNCGNFCTAASDCASATLDFCDNTTGFGVCRDFGKLASVTVSVGSTTGVGSTIAITATSTTPGAGQLFTYAYTTDTDGTPVTLCGSPTTTTTCSFVPTTAGVYTVTIAVRAIDSPNPIDDSVEETVTVVAP